jgi:rubrerythrin
MRKMTEENIQASFAGESQAHMKYLAFAEKAEKEDKPNVARLFRAAAFAEQIHAHDHLKVLKAVNDTAENLKEAQAGEDFEVTEMYPAYLAVAELEEEKRAQNAIRHAMEAEAYHRDLYGEALDAVASGGDFTDDKIVVCNQCGYVQTGEAPDRCPVCTAPKKYFEDF